MNGEEKTKEQLIEELQKLRQQVAELERSENQRKRTEEALAHERDLLHALMDNVPDTIYFKDATSCFMRINRAQAQVLGVNDPKEAIGKTDFDFFTTEHAQDAYADEQEIVKSGRPLVDKVEEIRRADGQFRWVSATKVPIKDKEGRVTGVVGISRDITKRRQAEAKLERRAVQLQAAAEVSRATTSTLNPGELMGQVVNLVRERFDLYYVGLFLLDEERKFAVLRAGTGEAGRKMLEEGHRLKVGGKSMIGWCLANKQARVALDVGEDAVRFDNPLLPETRSEMALPLVSRGQVIGAMTIQSAQPTAFSEEDITVLQTMADQLANAIENARLFEQGRQEITERKQAEAEIIQLNRELTTLNRIGQALISTLDLQETLDIITDHITQLLGVAAASVILRDEAKGDLWFAAASGGGAHFVRSARVAPEQGTAGWVVQHGEPLIVPDVSKDPRWFGDFDRESSLTTSSILCVPLQSKGQTIGAIEVMNKESGAFDQGDLRLLTSVAAMAATAIANARLFVEALARTREVTALAEMGRKLASTLELDAVLDSIMDACLEFFQVQQACFIMMDKDGYLRMRRHRGLSEEFVRSIVGRPGEGFYGKVYQSGKAVLVEDARRQLDPATAGAVLREGITSFVHVPVKVKGATVAVMNLTSLEEDRRFSERDLEQLSAFADQAAIAIENARLFEQTQQTSVLMGLRVNELTCLNDIGQKIAGTPPVPEFLQWVTERVPRAMQYPDLCLAAIEFEGQVYGMTEAVSLPCQIVQGLRIGGELVGRLYIAYIEKRDFLDEESALLGDVVRRVSGYIENRRLFEETRARAEELAVLYELGRALTARLSVEEVLEETHRGVSRLMDTTNFSIGLYDPERDEIHFALAIIQSVIDEQITVMPADQGLAGYIIRNRTSVLLEENVRKGQEALGIQLVGEEPLSWLGVPLIVGDRVLGVMAVQSFITPRLYGERDRDLLTAIANQAAIALQNARLFEQAQEEIAERKRAEEALRVSEERFALAMRGSTDGLWDWDIENSSLYWSPRLKEILGYADDELDVDFDTFESHLHPDDRENTGAAIAAHLKDRVLYDVEQRLRTKSGEYRWIRARGQAIWDEDGQPIRMVGSSTDITERKQAEAERERLLTEMETLARELAVLNELGQALTARLSVEEVLDEAYRQASRLVDTTNFYVGLYDQEKDEIAFVFEVSESEIDRQIIIMPASQGITGYIVRNRTSVLLGEDTLEWEAGVGIETVGQEALSWLGVPLMIGDRVLGVMAVQSYTIPNLYDEHDRDLLTAIANQTAIALQNAYLFEQIQARAEREKLVRTVTDRIHRGTDREAIMRTALQELGQMLGASQSIIRLGTQAQLLENHEALIHKTQGFR